MKISKSVIYLFYKHSKIFESIEKIKHIGFIMDGNRRWAKHRFLSPIAGHKKGLEVMHKIVNYAINKLHVKALSFYTFSTENWNRSNEEIKYLMNLIQNQISDLKFENWLMENNVQFIWNGFEDKLDKKIVEKAKSLMHKTTNNTGTKLQILLNYGSRQKVVEAVNEILLGTSKSINFSNLMDKLDIFNLGPIDLLIRTGNEKRLSNFMLLESAYAELIFRKCYWPSYSIFKLNVDLIEFLHRKRRFGK